MVILEKSLSCPWRTKYLRLSICFQFFHWSYRILRNRCFLSEHQTIRVHTYSHAGRALMAFRKKFSSFQFTSAVCPVWYFQYFMSSSITYSCPLIKKEAIYEAQTSVALTAVPLISHRTVYEAVNPTVVCGFLRIYIHELIWWYDSRLCE